MEVTSSASGCAKKRLPRKPRQPYMLLAVSLSACCRVSNCCRRSCSTKRHTAHEQGHVFKGTQVRMQGFRTLLDPPINI